ncbi:hypothetical protein BU23DRAFT_567930 [Bimuria novae-zelandiae CBS 107.79]|uniref:Extracellular membrane protein CFEM domain-containing protein n=1 Tax=Bimuria novae-zelandiae CBS 107.79 TaxID=1447943 RepID=A0A6A5VBV4_9PLEO|nr:hypothetical protein BU23DRAFT_567930 [Bimuria novae-zelandiae CBS 107.79]
MKLFLLCYFMLCSLASAQGLRRWWIPLPKFIPRPIVPAPVKPIVPPPEPIRPPLELPPPKVPPKYAAAVLSARNAAQAAAPLTPLPGAVQTQMANLERSVMNHVGTDLGGQFIEQLASALLGSRATSSQRTATPTGPVTASPLDMSLYQPCLSYASKLSSCALATPNFFTFTGTDWAVDQASCACYTSTASCEAPTLNTAFDDFASSCQGYLHWKEGYTKVASAMDGTGVMGPSFCSSAQMIIKTGYADLSLAGTLAPTGCAVPSPSPAPSLVRPSKGEGERSAGRRLGPGAFFTGFDRLMLAMRGIFGEFTYRWH